MPGLAFDDILNSKSQTGQVATLILNYWSTNCSIYNTSNLLSSIWAASDSLINSKSYGFHRKTKTKINIKSQILKLYHQINEYNFFYEYSIKSNAAFTHCVKHDLLPGSILQRADASFPHHRDDPHRWNWNLLLSHKGSNWRPDTSHQRRFPARRLRSDSPPTKKPVGGGPIATNGGRDSAAGRP